jgi:protein SCO1/2
MKTIIKKTLFLSIALAISALSSTASHADTGSANAASTAAAALPGDSIYQLPIKLTDQNGKTFDLASRRGQPTIVSMFYTSCQFVCPMLVETIQLSAEKLTPEERSRISSLLVTFDPARDDVKALKSIADKRSLDPAMWTLARTDAASVRKFAAALGIQYRLLSDGEYNHSTVLILLDGQGRIVGRTNKIGAVDPAFIKLLKSAAAKKTS